MLNLCKAYLTTLLLAALLSGIDALAQGASFEGVQGRPLISAIERGSLRDVESLLQRPGMDPNDFAGTDYAAIHAAAAKGNISIVSALLERGVDIDLPDKHVQRETPLFYAIDWGLTPMVKFLIDKGANVNAKTSHGYSALHKAAGADVHSLQMVRLLVARGADVNAAAMNKTTVLQSAVQKDNSEVVSFLLTSGANPEATTYFGATIVNDAVLGEHEQILQILLKHHVSLMHRDSMDGFAPLHNAAYRGNMRIAKMLLKADADPSLLTTNGKLAEEIAELRGHQELAEFLSQARRKR